MKNTRRFTNGPRANPTAALRVPVLRRVIEESHKPATVAIGITRFSVGTYLLLHLQKNDSVQHGTRRDPESRCFVPPTPKSGHPFNAILRKHLPGISSLILNFCQKSGRWKIERLSVQNSGGAGRWQE